MSVYLVSHIILIDTRHSIDPIDPNASPAVRLICNQQEIVWPIAHVKARLQLALCHHAPTGNVSYAVFGDALWKQDHVRRQLAYFRGDASPHLVTNEHTEPAVMVRRHMAADTL